MNKDTFLRHNQLCCGDIRKAANLEPIIVRRLTKRTEPTVFPILARPSEVQCKPITSDGTGLLSPGVRTEAHPIDLGFAAYERYKPRGPIPSGKCCCPTLKGLEFKFSEKKPTLSISMKVFKDSWFLPAMLSIYKFSDPTWEAKVDACGCGSLGWIQEMCEDCQEIRLAKCSRGGRLKVVEGSNVTEDDGKPRVDYENPERRSNKCPWFYQSFPLPLNPCGGEWTPVNMEDTPFLEFPQPEPRPEDETYPFSTSLVHSFSKKQSGKTHLVCKDSIGFWHIGHFEWEYEYKWQLKSSVSCRYGKSLCIWRYDGGQYLWVLPEFYELKKATEDATEFKYSNPEAGDKSCKRICKNPKATKPFDCKCSRGSSWKDKTTRKPTIKKAGYCGIH